MALCKIIGLVQPWTATTPGPELAATLAIYALSVGAISACPFKRRA